MKNSDDTIVYTMSFWLPCKTVEIGYTIKKSDGFPITEDSLLRLLRLTGDTPLSVVQSYFGFDESELEVVLTPLTRCDYVKLDNQSLILTSSGEKLFEESSDGEPQISSAYTTSNTFKIDRESLLPVAYAEEI